MAKHKSKRVISDKIKLLIDEGKPQKQAIAIALSMARAGKLAGKRKR
jgi:hypothetical protein